MRRIKSILAVTVATATMVVLTASPAMAQGFFVGGGNFDRDRFVGNAGPASQEFSIRRIRSGAASPVTNISNSGSNSNLCPTVQQVVNTGNVLNEQGAVLSGSGVDNLGGFVDGFGFEPEFFGFDRDIDFTGSNITIAPSASGSCTQSVEQAAAA